MADTSYEWHKFDEGRDWFVRPRSDGNFDLRTEDQEVRVFTPAEFDQLRAEGPNPQGLD